MKSFANQNSLADIQVVPLIGGTNRTDSEYQLNEMVRILAEKLHGNPTFIYAPAYTESVKDRELYMKSASMQLIEDKWSALDVAVVSVGAMPEFYDSYDSKVLLDPFVVKTVFEKDPDRAVGDICGRWFNIKGNFLKNEHNKQLIAIDEDKLAAVPKVICIASGNHKVLSLVGALRSKTIDILITDENTAKSVLDVSNI
jgi:DNA-binding transcriptional regulator LsrR (DeoR family)